MLFCSKKILVVLTLSTIDDSFKNNKELQRSINMMLTTYNRVPKYIEMFQPE